jgi:hypothetical protein
VVGSYELIVELHPSLEGESNMSLHLGAHGISLPISIEERGRILEQLERLLETHHFRNSRRYPALLRFIVEETLEGRGEFLKERLLGVRVFDRPADYDTAADPVVRVTIAEIRKRIAQYYHDEAHDDELRIELMPGSYEPEFRFRNAKVSTDPNSGAASNVRRLAVVPPTVEAVVKEPAETGVVPGRRRWPLQLWYLLALPASVLIAVFAGPILHRVHPSALEQLWSPFLGSDHPVLFCIPTDVGAKSGFPDLPGKTDGTGKNEVSGSPEPSFLAHEAMGENVVLSDMQATLKIVNILAAHHHDYRVRLNTSTNLEDLRQGPTVLIGGLDNQWTMRALAPLRFYFAGSDEDRYWIADRKNPGNRQWSLDLKQHYGAVTRDYAIVARLHNEQTGEPEVIVAGIGMSGTAAAGEFIGDERRVEELRQQLGRGFRDHDFEVVLSTDVVNGIAGSPKIVALSVF